MKKIILFFIGVLFSIIMVSCGDNNETSPTNIESTMKRVVSIAVKEDSVPEYIQTISLDNDLAKIKITVNYSDESSEEKNLNRNYLSASEYTILSTSGTHNVNIRYEGKTASLTLKVCEQCFTVTFKDNDNVILKSEVVPKNQSATAPEVGDKKVDNKDFTFSGWSAAFNNVTSDITVTAIYREIVYFTVYFYNGDTLLVSQKVEATKNAIEPTNVTKEPTNTLIYTFTGWSSSIQNITADKTVYAQFSESTRYYTVEFYAIDRVIDTQIVEYGSSVIAPTPTLSYEYNDITYSFYKWDIQFDNVTSNLFVRALYREGEQQIQYTVKFIIDGIIVKTETVNSGNSATAPENPTKDGYTFTGWDKAFSNVTANLEVTANFEKEKIKLEFGYLGAGNLDTLEYMVEPGVPLDPTDYISVPNSGYVFMGFSEFDFSNPTYGTFIKIYVMKVSEITSGKVMVSFLNRNYAYLSFEEVVIGGSITKAFDSFSYSDETGDHICTGWDKNLTNIMENMYTIPSYTIEDPVEVAFSSTPLSLTSAVINLSSDNRNDIIEIKYKIFNGTTIIKESTNFTETLEGLVEGTEYKIKGTYKYRLSNNTTYTRNIPEFTFTTDSYRMFENVDTTPAELHGNSFEIAVESYLNSCPEGYNLGGITVSLDGEFIAEIEYDGIMENFYVNELSAGNSYLVEVFYDPVTSRMHSLERPITPGYRIYFVGFYVMTYGDVNYRVRMIYNNETLYTFYVASGTSLRQSDVNSYVLPTKYDDYYIAGNDGDLNNISKDVDCNVTLLLNNPSTPYKVIVKNYFGQILDIVEYSNSIVLPELDEIVTDGLYRYKFKSWPTIPDNLTADFILCPTYTMIIEKKLPDIYNYSFFYNSTTFKTSFYISGNGLLTKDKYILDKNNNRIDLDELGLTNSLTANSDYKFVCDYTYDLDDGNGVQTDKYEYQFSTPAYTTYGFDLNVTETDYESVTVSFNTEAPTDGSYGVVAMKEDTGFSELTYTGFSTNSKISNLGNLYSNTVYTVCTYNKVTTKLYDKNFVSYIISDTGVEGTTGEKEIKVLEDPYIVDKGGYYNVYIKMEGIPKEMHLLLNTIIPENMIHLYEERYFYPELTDDNWYEIQFLLPQSRPYVMYDFWIELAYWNDGNQSEIYHMILQ